MSRGNMWPTLRDFLSVPDELTGRLIGLSEPQPVSVRRIRVGQP